MIKQKQPLAQTEQQRLLTGSASKGRSQYYYYYHCSTQCGCRYKAEVVNDAFALELRKYTLDTAMKELCAAVLLDVFYQDANESKDDRKSVIKQIDDKTKGYEKRANLC